MKTILYNLIFALLLLPAVVTGSNDFKGKYTKEKSIKKEYRVSANDLLKIENSYGNIDFTAWDENRVVIEVTIKTSGNDEEKVIERLKEIDVAFNQSGNVVSAETLLEQSSNSWWGSLFGGGSNVNFEINYRVKAPATNNVELENDYGSINLDRLKGNAKISSDYGRLMIGELHGDENIINFDYTRNSSIDYVKRAKINADYSEFNIGEAGTVFLNADYTDSNFEKVENLSFNNDYGSLKVDKLRNIKGEGDYLSVKLGSLYATANLSMDYGSLLINRLMPSVKEVGLETDYTGIKIGYDKDAPFSFRIDTAYGGVKGVDKEGFTMNKRNQSSGDDYYEGYYLSRDTGAKIRIDSSYGSVDFLD